MASKRKSRSSSASSTAKNPPNTKKRVVENSSESGANDFAPDPVIENSSNTTMDEDEEVVVADFTIKARGGSKRDTKMPNGRNAEDTEGEGEGEDEKLGAVDSPPKARARSKTLKSPKGNAKMPNGGNAEGGGEGECLFTSLQIPDDEARRRWTHRYLDNAKIKNREKDFDEEKEFIRGVRHFTQARVDGEVYDLYDDAYVMGESGEEDYICKIVEMFEGEDGGFYFNAQWFYRAKDTVIGVCGGEVDGKCVFFSEVRDDNPLDCLVRKVKIVKLFDKVDGEYKKKVRETCDFYYEMKYSLPYTSFVSNRSDGGGKVKKSERGCNGEKGELVLMDVYAGCGAMSTGLCLGASRGGVKLTTKWAIDINEYACASLRLNHPETHVRNEPAECFLSLIKEWYRLCESYSLIGANSFDQHMGVVKNENGEVNGCEDNEDEEEGEESDNDGEVYEVDEILEICYGDPRGNKEMGLHFKISWKGYGPEHNTWEPIDCLSGCPEKLKEFVVQGVKSKLLPLPGDVDVICGGPPCQGISGFNRFRNAENPLADEKNKQLIVFMDIVSFLKPKYVLMENVVDILKFAGAFLGKYALGRLVGMGYQARMGLMAAGCYGLPQFRMRVFLWGALSTEKLPQYALPTHKVVNRGVVPLVFEPNVVAYEEGQKAVLKKELLLEDALSDLPPVENNEKRDEMPYNGKPKTDFQRFIRLKKEVMLGSTESNLQGLNEVLYDHRPLQMNEDDHQRVCQIPLKKGACFRDLPGVLVGSDNKVSWDPNVERVYLPSGKPLVPDYAMTFVGGTSSAPFGRVWWDQTVPTVVTRAQPHNRCILHPTQSRVLTIRENARLQGFPDYYQLIGPIKQRYIQVGNAVAVPVARALGYCLAMASKGDIDDNQPVLELPSNFLQ